MEDLLEFLASGLVDDPDAVSVEGFDEPNGSITLELTVADDEKGRVIGRGGRTISALRTVIRAMPNPDGQRVAVEIVE